jgi:exodeoxyribonuclease VIII
MPYTDVSIDLETLGVRPGSVITQIGLCAFNRRPSSGGEATTSATNILVAPQSMIDAGFFIDWSTVSWWLQQNEAARVGMATQAGDNIQHALFKVGDWFAENVGLNKKSYCVWGHGSGFDCTQLEIAFQKLGLPVPWDFRNVRDLRTLIDLAPADAVARPAPRVEHNAMDDATAQAEWIKNLTYQIEKRHVNVIAEQPQGPAGSSGHGSQL